MDHSGIRGAERLPFKTVLLSGTWFEMGCQYVRELATEMGHIYDTMLAGKMEDPDARRLALALYESGGDPIRRFFDGMEESGPFTREQLMMIQAVEYVRGLGGCSAIAVWGSRTPDGRVLFGRNYDYNGEYLQLNRDLAVTVFAPADGSRKFLTVGYAGQIYCVSGVNESGVFVELNNGSPSGGTVLDQDRPFSTAMLMQLLAQARNLGDVDRFFGTRRSNFAYLIGVSDRNRALCYEWDRTGTKLSPPLRPEMTVLTNTYTHPDWPFPVPDESRCWHSDTRRRNMTALAERPGSAMTAEDIRRIISLPLTDGGTFFEEEEKTVYQMVYDGSGFCLHLKVTGNGDWVRLPLDRLLNPENISRV